MIKHQRIKTNLATLQQKIIKIHVNKAIENLKQEKILLDTTMRRYHKHSLKNLILYQIHSTYFKKPKNRFQYTATQVHQITKACCQQGIGYARYKTGNEEMMDVTARMIIQAINESHHKTTDHEVNIICKNLTRIYQDPENNINIQTHMNVKIMSQIKELTPQLWGTLIKGYITDELEDLKTDWTPNPNQQKETIKDATTDLEIEDEINELFGLKETTLPTTDDQLDELIQNEIHRTLAQPPN